MMRDSILYLQGWVSLGLLLLVALKLLAMHGSPLSHNENQKDFATNSPNKGSANELDEHWNMPNHCTSIYHEWMCVCVAALKVIVTRYTAQSVMWTCMLPRELIWERVAPSHTGVTQNSGWPLLQLLYC